MDPYYYTHMAILNETKIFQAPVSISYELQGSYLSTFYLLSGLSISLVGSFTFFFFELFQNKLVFIFIKLLIPHYRSKCQHFLASPLLYFVMFALLLTSQSQFSIFALILASFSFLAYEGHVLVFIRGPFFSGDIFFIQSVYLEMLNFNL